jgi:hypothetical protein
MFYGDKLMQFTVAVDDRDACIRCISNAEYLMTVDDDTSML